MLPSDGDSKQIAIVPDMAPTEENEASSHTTILSFIVYHSRPWPLYTIPKRISASLTK